MAAPASPAEARRLAIDILGERRFRPERPPQPFRRPLTWLGRQLARFWHVVSRWFGKLVPDGAGKTASVIVGVAVLVLAAVVAWRLGRRRAAVSVDRSSRKSTRRDDPEELELRAEAAARAGDYGEAVRLRFVAGLIRLERAEAISVAERETTADIVRELASTPSGAAAVERFRPLALTFDAVVYGDVPASSDDAHAAEDGWERVLETVNRS